MDIDNLSIGLKVNGADDAIKRIQQMATAVETLARGITQVDASRFQEVANGLALLKANAPTSNQATSMEMFANAISTFAGSLNGLDITQVASDISNLTSNLTGVGASGVRSFNALAQAAQNFNNQVQQSQNNVAPNPANATPNANNIQPTLNNVTQLNEQLNQTAISAQSLGGRLQRIGAIVPTSRFRSLSDQLDNVRRRYDELRERMNQSLQSGEVTPDSQQYQRWARNLEHMRNEYDRLIERQRALALEGRGFQLSPTLQAGLDGFKKGFNGVISVVKNGFVGAIRSANKHISSFVKNISGANSAQKAMQKTMNSLKSMPEKFAKEIARMGKMLKLMITRMALRQVIKEVGEGFKSLAVHSDNFNDSMSSVINASKQLGYSFSAMVSPLINALAPAIVNIINLLTQLLNIINQVFSVLTGASTWNKAKDFTDSWRDSFDKTGKSAGKTAKELKKTVLGFDELNQLQENKNSGGGGGSDIKDMFETMQIDPKWKEFADWLKDMWKNKDFYDLGQWLGEKLRDWLESIPWEEIRRTSNDLGKCLASLINGLVEVDRLGYDIGYTLAQGVNTVFEFFNGFVHKLHWDSVGKFIADTFNGFFENIDWPLIKDTVITGIAGIADAINAFIKEFHWDNISNTLINGINIVIHAVNTFFRRIKWKELGQNLGEQLQKTIEGIHWDELGETLGRILQSAIDFVSNFVHQLKVDEIRAKLKEMVDSFFDTVDTEELGQTLADIIDLVVQIAAGFWEDNKDRLWEEGKKLVKGLFDGLDDDTKNYIRDAVGTVITTAVLAGLALASVKILGSAVAGTAGAGLQGAAAGAGAATGLAFAVGMAGSINSYVTNSSVIKDAVLNVAEAFGANKEYVDRLRESYSGFGGTVKLVKDGLDIAWKGLTGRTDEIKDMSYSFGDLSETSQKTSASLREFAPDVDGLNRAFADLGEPLQNDKKYVSEIGGSVDVLDGTLTESIGISESFRSSMGDLDKQLQGTQGEFKNVLGTVQDTDGAVKNYKTTTDVIRDAQAKNVEQTSKVREMYAKVKDVTGEVTSKLKDNKPALDGVRDSSKEASDKLNDYTNKTKDAIKVMPEMSKESKDVQTSMNDVQKAVTDTTASIQKSFTKDNWTFSGVAEGLKATFEGAKEAIKGVWNSIAEKLNGEHDIGETSMRIHLPTFATGGFPEDGLFMANRGELVGSFPNGKTAVANNAQIVEGIQSGVYKAVMSAMSQQSSSSSYISNEILVDGEVIARTITKAQEKQSRRYSPQTV